MTTPRDQITGRRLPDTKIGEWPLPYDKLRSGDIWKVLNKDGTERVVDHPSNLTGRVWFFVAPGRMFANMEEHTVREHDDGTVSIRPGDGSSNSILIMRPPNKRWHGYVEHNLWRSVD